MVRSHLEHNYPDICRSFSEVEGTNGQAGLSEILLSRQAGGFAFEYWCRGGDLQDLESLFVAFNDILGKNEAVGARLNKEGKEGLAHQVFGEVIRNVEHVSSDPTSSVWAKPLSERLSLVKTWQEEIGVAKMVDQVIEIHRRHRDSLRHQTVNRAEMDAQIFRQRDVIG